jgi:rhodanese-related sulfurtransferase
VKPDSTQTVAPAKKAEIIKALLEAALVAVIGAAFAFAANELSPRGLRLARNYFPGASKSLQPAAATTNLARAAGGTNLASPSVAELVTARLKGKGLQLINLDQMKQLLHDPRYAQGLIMLVDAREDDPYQEGHIPGAYQLDHYHPENYIADVLPACQTATQIVVYCSGGDCEDSEFTAVTLREIGIPNEKLFVYPGGMSEWTTHALPIELGARNSGKLRDASK